MNKKYSIGFFTASIIAFAILSYAYQFSYESAKERAEEEKMLQSQEYISADGEALKENCYYLMEVNGYIVVYLSDKKTPYEYTDIILDDLPETIRQEIKNGKYIESTEELYGFLENYSS